ncbi:MAG: PHP domain-containing protein, partial [Myxococcaceae bacterium]
MERMVGNLNAMGIPVSMALVERVAGSDNLCRPHLARALVELGLCRDAQEAFSRFSGDGLPGYSPHHRPDAAEAIRLIRGAGGVATLAHPASDGIDRSQIGVLKQLGLGGLEVFHSDHNPSVREKYLKVARELDLVPTAGSDFHGVEVAPNAVLGTASLAPAYFEALRARASA